MYAILEDGSVPESLHAAVCVVVCCPRQADPQVVLLKRNDGWRVPGLALSAGKGPVEAAAELVTALTGVSCRSRPGESGFFAVGRLHAVDEVPGDAQSLRTLVLSYGVAVPDTFALPEPDARWVSLSGLTEHPHTLAAVAEVLRAL